MTTLTRELLLRPAPRRYDTVELPEFTARIQSLSNGEMRQLRQSLLDKKGDLNRKRADRLQELLVCHCLVDDGGTRLFSDEDAFAAAWDGLDGALMRVLFDRCKRWTGFAADDDWNAIEAAAKNSEETNAKP
jgi:hypothetical protein